VTHAASKGADGHIVHGLALATVHPDVDVHLVREQARAIAAALRVPVSVVSSPHGARLSFRLSVEDELCFQTQPLVALSGTSLPKLLPEAPPTDLEIPFTLAHLHELTALVDRELTLPESWSTAKPNTMLAVMRDEADIATSAGVLVLHTAFTGPDAQFLHTLSIVAARPGLDVAPLGELAMSVACWLGVEANVQPASSAPGATIVFKLSRESEEAFQRDALDPAKVDLLVAAETLSFIARTRPQLLQSAGALKSKPWWRFW
jgi:hypothetical protein